MNDIRQFAAFEARLDAMGADLARWPEDDAEEAVALLARSPEARARHAEAKRFDALVAEAAEVRTPDGFAFRLVADMAARRAEASASFFGPSGAFRLAAGGVCASALALGVLLGAFFGPGAGQSSAAGLDLGGAVEMSILDGDL